jgi:hypothetical protein
MVFAVSEELGNLLVTLELQDSVLFETVDLTAFLPLLSGPPPTALSGSRKAIIDRDSITNAKINARKQRKVTQAEESNSHEKEGLLQRRTELLGAIEGKTQRLEELHREKQRLEKQRADQMARVSRLGSSLQVHPPAPQEGGDAAYWKQAYYEIERSYRELKESLSQKGALQHFSVGQVRVIPPPDVFKMGDSEEGGKIDGDFSGST